MGIESPEKECGKSTLLTGGGRLGAVVGAGGSGRRTLPELAREAARGLTARAQEYSPIGSLLMDLFLVFTMAEMGRMFSRRAGGALLGSGERPWAELRKGHCRCKTTEAMGVVADGT